MKKYEKPQMEIIELSGAGVIAEDPVNTSDPEGHGEAGDGDW